MHTSNGWQLDEEGKKSQRYSEIIDNVYTACISKVFEADNGVDF